MVLGCGGLLNTGEEEFGNFVSSITLYDWLFNNFSHRTILSSAEFFEKVQVALAAGDGSVILRPDRDVTVLIPIEVSDDSISTSVTIYDEMLTAPIDAGTVLGKVVVSIDGEEQGSINLVNNSAVELSKLEFIKLKLGEFFSKGWVITLIIIVVVLLVVYLILAAVIFRSGAGQRKCAAASGPHGSIKNVWNSAATKRSMTTTMSFPSAIPVWMRRKDARTLLI